MEMLQEQTQKTPPKKVVKNKSLKTKVPSVRDKRKSFKKSVYTWRDWGISCKETVHEYL